MKNGAYHFENNGCYQKWCLKNWIHPKTVTITATILVPMENNIEKGLNNMNTITVTINDTITVQSMVTIFGHDQRHVPVSVSLTGTKKLLYHSYVILFSKLIFQYTYYSRNNVSVTQTWRDVIVTYRKQDRDMTIDMLIKIRFRRILNSILVGLQSWVLIHFSTKKSNNLVCQQKHPILLDV